MKIEKLIRTVLQVLAPSRSSSSSTTTAPPRGTRRSRPGSATARPARPGQPSSARPSSRHEGTAPAASTDGGIVTYDVERWGAPTFSYSPDPDGDADPGEVVWGWVPFEEDATQGKDRPLLIVGTLDRHLVGVQMTSKDHTRDAEREHARGRIWVDLGSGAWDSQGRDSEARIDRVLLVDRGAVRREGATLGRRRFDAVVGAMRTHHGW